MSYGNFTAKDEFLYKAYNKTLIEFLKIKKGSEVTRENGLYIVKKITPECVLDLTLIRPLKIGGLLPKASCRVSFMSVKTLDGKSVLTVRNNKKFKALWRRKKSQAKKDWKTLEQEKREKLKSDPAISFRNN